MQKSAKPNNTMSETLRKHVMGLSDVRNLDDLWATKRCSARVGRWSGTLTWILVTMTGERRAGAVSELDMCDIGEQISSFRERQVSLFIELFDGTKDTAFSLVEKSFSLYRVCVDSILSWQPDRFIKVAGDGLPSTWFADGLEFPMS